MSYTFDTIGQWVEELASKPKIAQFRVYAQTLRDKERTQLERDIINKFDNKNSHLGGKDVSIVNDEISIVIYTPFKGKVKYVPVVNGIPSIWWFESFDSALLGALSIKNTGDPEAAKYAGKILEVEM